MAYKDPLRQVAYDKAYYAANKDFIKARHAASTKARNTTPWAKYGLQRNAARQRGIEFLLTFEEWLDIWGDKLSQRGKGTNRLCMSRHGDVGPYAVGNVSIITHSQNSKDRHRRQL